MPGSGSGPPLLRLASVQCMHKANPSEMLCLLAAKIQAKGSGQAELDIMLLSAMVAF